MSTLPPIKCPKCAHRQFDDESCARCGLVFALAPAPGEAPWEAVPLGKGEAVDEAERLWRAVEAEPESVERNDAFVRHVLEFDLLDMGLRRYRHHVSDHPDQEEPRRALERLVERATAVASAMLDVVGSRTRSVERTGRLVKNGLLVLVSAALVYAVFLGWRILRGMGGGGF
ncbi:MAG: hypothetical protein EA398_07345 [Deltaproteobacteria bacterium]|nr:MAG: hypothetical protein EA398_07345 [Deltaproteobacteria bacterium]